MSMALIAGAAALGVATAAILAIVLARRQVREVVEVARTEAQVSRQGARIEAASQRRALETEAREQSLRDRDAADADCEQRRTELAAREEQLIARAAEVDRRVAAVDERRREVDGRYGEIRRVQDRAQGLRSNVDDLREQTRAQLEKLSEVSRDDVVSKLIGKWTEKATAQAAHRLRLLDQGRGDAEVSRAARRLMEVAIGRYKNHFLTERAVSTIRVTPQVKELLVQNDSLLLRSVTEVANIQLHELEGEDAFKLEGLDGVGREVARRALSRLCKRPKAAAAALEDPSGWAHKIRSGLDNEIMGLGKKAFQVLCIKKSHPEITSLVGRLNYRTSYTQNQWRHAVEAAFICGMMADELGLDVKQARRAALLHDIGKALTHEIEGSHALIGAEVARRLGEDEITCNAAGAHHGDEPPTSIYAYLVAAADAMSGARPGARRECADGYSTRLQDLERIASSHQGVDRCYAVHGGRELRVYVDDGRVDDGQAELLSAEIAARISEEMTFPGQIKVTVIRATEAVAVAS